jgi:hypothetical protein
MFFKNNFFVYLSKYHQDLVRELDEKGELTGELKLVLDQAVKNFFRVQNPQK